MTLKTKSQLTEDVILRIIDVHHYLLLDKSKKNRMRRINETAGLILRDMGANLTYPEYVKRKKDEPITLCKHCREPIFYSVKDTCWLHKSGRFPFDNGYFCDKSEKTVATKEYKDE